MSDPQVERKEEGQGREVTSRTSVTVGVSPGFAPSQCRQRARGPCWQCAESLCWGWSERDDKAAAVAPPPVDDDDDDDDDDEEEEDEAAPKLDDVPVMPDLRSSPVLRGTR